MLLFIRSGGTLCGIVDTLRKRTHSKGEGSALFGVLLVLALLLLFSRNQSSFIRQFHDRGLRKI
jgi:hypothetical protein